jgi:hypothetical protein
LIYSPLYQKEGQLVKNYQNLVFMCRTSSAMDDGKVSEFDDCDESGASCSGDESGALRSCTGDDGEFTQVDARQNTGASASCTGDGGEFTQIDARQNTGTPGSSTVEASAAQGGCQPASQPLPFFVFSHVASTSLSLVGRPVPAPVPAPVSMQIISFTLHVGYDVRLLLPKSPSSVREAQYL